MCYGRIYWSTSTSCCCCLLCLEEIALSRSTRSINTNPFKSQLEILNKQNNTREDVGKYRKLRSNQCILTISLPECRESCLHQIGTYLNNYTYCIWYIYKLLYYYNDYYYYKLLISMIIEWLVFWISRPVAHWLWALEDYTYSIEFLLR
jgi:hypothetical protein